MRRRPHITELNFDRGFEMLRERVRAAVSPFGDTSLELKEKRRERARGDYFFFARTYLPHWFSCDPAPMHREWVELADWKPEPAQGEVLTPVVIAAPRGFAKSTIMITGYFLQQAVFELRRFMLVGTETKDLARAHVLDICAELAENPRLIYDFGELLDYAPKSADITLGNKVRLMARGAGQAVRGVKKAQHRPDLAGLDDLESDQSAKSPEQVQKVLNWVLGTIYPALDPAASMFVIGTILSGISAMHTMIHSQDEPWPEWTRRIYKAYDDGGNSAWPAKYSLPVLKAQEKKMGWAQFSKEKLNEPLDDENFFQPGWIKIYTPAELPRSMAIAGFYDPATGSGDFGGVVVLAKDLMEPRYYVLHARLRRESVTASLWEILRLYAACLRQYTGQVFLSFGFEDNGFQSLIADLLPELEKKAGVALPTRRVTTKTAKSLRIESLAPFVERGLILFNPEEGDQKLLIRQLLAYPKGHDDGPDALEGALSALRSYGDGQVAYESVSRRRVAGMRRGTW